jgi:hypothetical protein
MLKQGFTLAVNIRVDSNTPGGWGRELAQAAQAVDDMEVPWGSGSPMNTPLPSCLPPASSMCDGTSYEHWAESVENALSQVRFESVWMSVGKVMHAHVCWMTPAQNVRKCAFRFHGCDVWRPQQACMHGTNRLWFIEPGVCRVEFSVELMFDVADEGGEASKGCARPQLLGPL